MFDENKSQVMQQVPGDSALMLAWKDYSGTAAFDNSLIWAAHQEHREGSMWAAFESGWRAGLERAAYEHESVNPASDDERNKQTPGAGAMGAVIEYRDRIRKIV